jgi:hypothetical protein
MIVQNCRKIIHHALARLDAMIRGSNLAKTNGIRKRGAEYHSQCARSFREREESSRTVLGGYLPGTSTWYSKNSATAQQPPRYVLLFERHKLFQAIASTNSIQRSPKVPQLRPQLLFYRFKMMPPMNAPLDDRTEEIRDILAVMQKQESTIYARQCNADELVALWRKMLIGWMYYVVDYCRLQRQSVAAAAFFFDIAMSRGLITTREEHQLAAATALQLSLKTFDTAVISAGKLVQLGRGLFTEDDVVEMEMKILKSLNWHTHPPSTYCFLRQYERLLPCSVEEPTKEMIQEVTNLISELTVSEIKYNNYHPSIIAFGAMLLAMELVDSDDLLMHQRQCFLVKMLTVAGLESSSSKVLEVFEVLKATMDESEKLQALVDSLASARRATLKLKPVSRSNSETVLESMQSPRHVMQRVGSSSWHVPATTIL